jgi:putative endonuclease
MIRKFTSKTQQLGQIGENAAEVFLMKQGFTIIDRNIHNRHGEIDIYATMQKKHYFFEVKTGKQGSWFNPADNLTKEKLWKFCRAVEYFSLKAHITQYYIQAIIVLLPHQEKDTVFIEIIDLS